MRRARAERRSHEARESGACQLARWRDARRSRVSSRRHPSRSARHPCAIGEAAALLMSELLNNLTQESCIRSPLIDAQDPEMEPA